jgi:hypothetical protein
LRRFLSSLLFAAFFASSASADDKVNCLKTDEGHWYILIRNDFTDLGPFSCTHGVASSQGATFSWTNNLLTKQNTVSADGLIVFDYSLVKDSTRFLQGLSLGPYIQVDDTYQFQPTARQSWNGYTVTPGGFAEFDMRNPFLNNGTLYQWGTDAIRIREGEVIVNTGTNYDSFVGEWIPSYYTKFLKTNSQESIGKSGLAYTFTPEFMVQYDHWDSGPITPAIFSVHNEALRIGPEFLLIFGFVRAYLPPSLGFMENCSIQLTNHESWDQDSGKEYVWSAVAINYTFDNPTTNPKQAPHDDTQVPHFGLSASFGVGNAELTGNFTKQFKIGLAVKM